VVDPLVGGGNMKFLVESEGDLLLVDAYECRCVNINNLVRINLFKLYEKEKKWVKLTSLGDRVLFLGTTCTFSASTSDLCVTKGNCVIFPHILFEVSILLECQIYFFDLDQAQVVYTISRTKYLSITHESFSDHSEPKRKSNGSIFKRKF
jgi:hypothetical protein